MQQGWESPGMCPPVTELVSDCHPAVVTVLFAQWGSGNGTTAAAATESTQDTV